MIEQRYPLKIVREESLESIILQTSQKSPWPGLSKTQNQQTVLTIEFRFLLRVNYSLFKNR